MTSNFTKTKKSGTSNQKKILLIKLAFVLLVLLTWQNGLRAQSMGYSFANSTGTYTPITGGTVHSSGSLMDDATFSVTLPFTFTFNGTAYTQVYVSENGYISFGSTDPSTTTRSAISSTNTGFELASPFSGDLQGISTSEMRSQTIGTAPNRTFIAQWTNLQFYLGSGQSFNYQIQLDEANGVLINQVIRFVYGTVSNTSSGTAQVGLRGINNTFYQNRTNTTAWNSTTAGTANTSACTISSTVAPASGLTYTWAPLPQTYTSSTTTQNTNLITPGSTDQQIIGIQVVTGGGSTNPLSLTALNLSTAGSTNVGDISNAKVYYTGTNATFSTTTQYGSTVTFPSGAFTVSGAQNLAVGTNYFWLAYDVSSGASIGNVLDAQCTQITVSSNNYVPTVTNPTGSRAVSVPFAGNYNIGAGQTYTTLTAAVNAINSAGMTAPVTFTLIDATYSTSETFPIVINQLSGSSATNTLTIKPSSGNIPTITGSAASLITLNGADNIIIDGSAYGNNSREMTFINNSTSTSAVIFISSLGTGLGARNVTVQNCYIQAGSSTATGCIGIYAGGTTISTTGTGADNDKLSIINNGVTKAYYGIYCRGVASTGMLDTLIIANNTVGSNTSNAVVLFDGIDVQNATLSSVYNNTIFNMTQTSGISTNPVAINLGGTLVTTNIYNNIIDGVRNPSSGGWGAYGINLAGTITTANIYNNAISNISTMNYSTSSTTYNAFGIRITVAGTYNLYNNSINLYGPVPNVGTTAHMSACLLAIAGTTINMRNNVFVNSQTGLTGAKSYAIYSTVAATAYATTTNRNDYFVSGSNGVLGFIASTDQTTLSAWKTAMGSQRDSISVNTDPLFNSNSIIRPTALSPLLNAGAPLSIVTTDLRGVTRNAITPSIGAYEEGGEFIPPVITFTPLTNATSTSNRVLTGFATITDTSGINITASTKPRIYYKKSSNANTFVGNTSADNGWKWVESGNTTSPFNFTINYSLLTGGSVTPGDQIQYFVVAQDLAATPNVTVVNNIFIRTAPSSVDLTSASFPIYGFNSYTIALQLSGNINVGTGQTYTSLTNTGGLFEAINNNVVGGNINALITSDITETGTNALNQTSENGTGNYTITIAPSAATLRTISGAFAGGLIKLNGADRIVIDGRFSGSGNFLTFQNTQASGTTGCIQLMSLGNGLGCVNTTVRNCNFIMPRTGVSSGAIFAGGLSINTTGSDNDSISLINNYVQSAAAGFVLSGNTGFENDFITVSGNTIDTVSQAGLNMSNARSFTISNNNINNVIGATGVVIAGVSLSSNVRNGVFTQNTISNVLSLDQNAFGVSMGTSDSNIVFNRNIIKKVVHTGVSGWGGKGIDVNTGLASSAIRIFNNMVTGVAGDGYSTITSDANIGIRINGATGGISVYYNTVNMYGNANRSGATTDISAAFAVASTSTSNLDVRNNIFRNTLVNGTGIQKSYAIYHAGTNGSQFSNLAYNNYVVGGSQGVMAFINAADVTNLGTWKTVTTKDSLSQSKAVNFIDSVNLRLTGASLGDYYLRALPIAGITTDFDNATRNSAITYMGMFEGTPALTMTANAGTDKITCAGVGVQIGSASIISGGIAPYTYSWNPTATAVSNPTVSPTLTTSYIVTVTDTFGFSAIDTVLVTVNPVIANNTLTGNQTICSGSTPTGLTGATPTGGTGTYAYTWLSSTTSATVGFAAASGTNNTQNYTAGALTQNTWYRRVVSSGTCNADTAAAIAVTVNAAGTWVGATSTAWGNTANWSCPQIPTSSTNVTINSGATNMPTITDVQQCNNLTINSGATLTLTGATAQLNLYGVFTNNGTFTNTSTGKTVFSGSSQQTVPAGNYTKLQINNAAGVVLGGAVVLSDSLLLSNGILTLGANNLTLGTSSYAGAGNAGSYIKTNGAGAVIVNGVGSTGKTGSVMIPVGNTTYNPATLLNTGTTDNYTVRLFDSVTTNYTGSAATGAKLTSNALNRTWIINEGTAGGSNATVTLQWNTADELSGFTRALSYVARYNGTVWTSTTATAATGSNPYTQTRSGITSFSPFSVGSGGTLPVTMLDFTGHKVKESVILNWSTASEINNDYFIVERSSDNNTFEAINEKIKGQGNSNNINQYNSIDFDAVNYASTNNSSVIYYRLRQVDFDGTINYSKPISVSINKTDLVFDATVSPNPFYSNLNLNISTTTNTAIDIELVDIRGVVAHKETLQTVLGSSLYSLDNLSGLANGMYFVKVTQGSNVKVIKLNKIQ